MEGGAVEVPSVEVEIVGVGNDECLVNLGGLGANVHGIGGDQVGKVLICAGTENLTTFILAVVVVCDRIWGSTGASRVVDYTLDIVRLDCSRTSILVVETKPVVSHCLISPDDNLVTLSDVYVENVSLVRNDWDKIGRDDCHGVVVNVKLVGGLDSSVDNVEHVSLV